MKKYVRSWRMEALSAALLAALLPEDVERRFYDDRFEPIPFDEPTDLVTISVETYTAKRSYQIASEYRRRGVPVVMGGFHATLCPDEVKEHCESIVIGEAEDVFPELIDDYRHGRPREIYRASERPDLSGAIPDRSIFAGKGYLPIKLVEFARGCRFQCEFCAVQSFFGATQTHRPVDEVVEEIRRLRTRFGMFFFIDDNLTSDIRAAKELMRALMPLNIRWVSQSSIVVAHDEEALELMRRSGCQGILVGFESLNPANLAQMNKTFNSARGGPEAALAKFRKHGIPVYGTFIFGYDTDVPETFQTTVEFATQQGLMLAAFNHITPFPGTPLYERMRSEGRLLFDPWWLDDDYRYNMVPFRPAGMSPEELASRCLAARRAFYSWGGIAKRTRASANRRTAWRLLNFLAVNGMHHLDIETRSGLPLGDETWQGELLKA